MRMPGPPGAWYSVIVPGQGVKRSGSSALMRHSMVCPSGACVFGS